MRHRWAGRKLGRNSSHRKAMLRSMVTSLFKHEQLETTDAKAKALRPVAEKMITLAKRGDLHARRQALAYIREKPVTHKLFAELKDRYLGRNGGYLRIIKKGNRKGDGAPVSVIQLVSPDQAEKKGKKKGKVVKTQTPPGEKKKRETKAQRKAKEVEKESPGKRPSEEKEGEEGRA